jgi:quercetin dioxygenase-like cupin family protein
MTPRENLMKHTRTICLLLGLIVALERPAFAEADDRPLMKLPQEIEYSGAPDQLQNAVVFGDLAKPGLYVQRFRFPPGLKVPPHWHPEEMRTVVVLSGTLYYAFGEQWDEKKLVALPAGSFFYEPPHVPHFAWAKDGEVILQLTAIGPTGTTIVPQRAQ